MRHIQARVPDDTYKRFRKAATDLGMTLEYMIATATEEFVTRKEVRNEVTLTRSTKKRIELKGRY